MDNALEERPQSESHPRSCLPTEARSRIEVAFLRATRVRIEAEATIEARWRAEAPESDLKGYISKGQASIELDRAKLEAARLMLPVFAQEYVAAGKSPSELWQAMNAELEGLVADLGLRSVQRNVLAVEVRLLYEAALVNWKRPEIENALPTQRTVLETPSNSKGRKRGPKPKYEDALRVERIVKRVAPDEDWRSKLDDVGEALDHGVCNAPDPKTCDDADHEKILLPRGWKKKGNDWLNPPDRGTMVKAIEYRLEIARKKRTPETLS
jgi:hypothetical protein